MAQTQDGPKTAQKGPKMCQNSQRCAKDAEESLKTAKKDPKTATKTSKTWNKNQKKMKDKIESMVENALSRRSRFSKLLAPILEPKIIFLIILWTTSWSLLAKLLKSFGNAIWDQIHPKDT